jgi:predicted XRE-type DNA-binding protein
MTRKEKSFKEILAEIEDPKNIGRGSWSLPRNATAAEKTKYEICEKILGYQEDNDLSDEAMARKTHLTQSELEDILFCRISKFSLDYLMNIASNLFSSGEIKIAVKEKKLHKGSHARV